MKHIIKFQKFLENTQSTIDKILDKISSGEEISKYEKDILDKFSQDVDIEDVFVDSFNFLKSFINRSNLLNIHYFVMLN